MNEIQNEIVKNCGNDISQIQVIISDKKKMLVEAPAGYGKTRTLLFKCIYMLSEKIHLNYNKKFLILTFTNNGISRLKKDLENVLNNLNLSNKIKKKIKSRIEILNFHTLAKKILSKYGFKIDSNLKEIYSFEFLNNSKFNNSIFNNMSVLIEKRKSDLINENLEKYLIELKPHIPERKLPYDSILFLLLDLLNKYPQISKFYKTYYENIFIDEFQDSNILAVKMTNRLFFDKERNNRYYFGDSLQTIFEFSGADPDRFDKYKKGVFKDFYFKLDTNYRFKDNENLKNLEKEFRNYYNGDENKLKVNLDVNIFNTPEKESDYIFIKCESFINSNEKTVILIGNTFGNLIKPSENINLLNKNYFFNALFDDESDKDKYFTFCDDCLKLFNNFNLEQNKFIFKEFYQYFKNKYVFKNYPFEKNYLYLFESFIKNYLLKEVNYYERTDYLIEILENYQLIKFIEYIEGKIPIITIHRSKGLEWDNVIIVNANKGIFGGNLKSTDKEDLRLYYVAITRAKKRILFSMNRVYYKFQVGTGLKSDFFNLKFIKLNEI